MASVDIITATGQAYMTVWEERTYLARMVLIPILVKMACYTLAIALGYHENIIRLSLFLIPSYFVEGWVLAHLVRLIFLNQRWPFKPTGNEKKDALMLQSRARGIMSGVISFVLINLLLGGYLALAMHYMPQDPQTFAPRHALIGILVVVSSVWGFRLIWTYVPLAINFSAIDYLKKINGFLPSFYLIGIWLLCSVPMIIAMQFSASLAFGMGGNEGGSAAQFIAAGVSTVFDSVKNLVCTAGIAYGLKEMLGYEERA